MKKVKAVRLEWIKNHVNYLGDDCIAWPYSHDSKGYCQLMFEGVRHGAHRKMCELAHGPPPTPKHQARHLCGNGHKGCLNPKHLAWGTPSENSIDAVMHGAIHTGEKSHSAKLTEAVVLSIRTRRAAGEKCKVLAKEYGVTPENISAIARRKSWSWLKD